MQIFIGPNVTLAMAQEMNRQYREHLAQQSARMAYDNAQLARMENHDYGLHPRAKETAMDMVLVDGVWQLPETP